MLAPSTHSTPRRYRSQIKSAPCAQWKTHTDVLIFFLVLPSSRRHGSCRGKIYVALPLLQLGGILSTTWNHLQTFGNFLILLRPTFKAQKGKLRRSRPRIRWTLRPDFSGVRTSPEPSSHPPRCVAVDIQIHVPRPHRSKQFFKILIATSPSIYSSCPPCLRQHPAFQKKSGGQVGAGRQSDDRFVQRGGSSSLRWHLRGQILGG